MHVVIVESPAKAKTINHYLGRDYKVLASFGHVRDLPAKDGSVDPENNFSMLWAIEPSSAKHLAEIAKAVKESEELILATDPDREGEAISWHVLEALKQKKVLTNKKISRVVFNAITKQSVLQAIANPRDIDTALVEAYLARRALDYLVGFTLSPVLWHKLPGARSAGRVQSVALRLICDQESEIEQFIRREYWSISASILTSKNQEFKARLVSFDNRSLEKLDIGDESQAKEIKSILEKASFKASSVEVKSVKRNPFAPFTTSTLQQAASSQLGFSPSRTMQLAQRLYEGIEINGETHGLITYMRTDGVHMAPEAIEAARVLIKKDFSPSYLPEKPRLYTAKAKNAQEAHEAIRPTDFSLKPHDAQKHLDKDQAKLYAIIWRRSIASQMKSADIERTIVRIEAIGIDKKAELQAVGSVIRFDGFMAAMESGKEEKEENEEDKLLPKIEEGEMLKAKNIEACQHMTEPPARYSEAGLVKKMEELGIGRPSTYASVLKTLEERGYVTIEKRRLLPHSRGRIVTAFLCSFFQKYVEYDFTADLEKKLDNISNGKLLRNQVLSDFWSDFSASIENIRELRVSDVLDKLNEDLAYLLFSSSDNNKGNPRACPKCENGMLSLKMGKYGAFIGCSNYPDCNHTRELASSTEAQDKSQIPSEGIRIGDEDSESAQDIFLRSGRFGSYLQKGEGKEAKRLSLPKEWDPMNIDPLKAKALFSLPREIGNHPETGETVSSGFGRYGAFILHKGRYVNLDTVQEAFNITMQQALSLFSEKNSENRFAAKQTKEIRNLGAHPQGGGDIIICEGRYGPYIKYGKLNATLPQKTTPESLSLEQAQFIIAEKISKGVSKKGASKKRKTNSRSKKKP